MQSILKALWHVWQASRRVVGVCLVSVGLAVSALTALVVSIVLVLVTGICLVVLLVGGLISLVIILPAAAIIPDIETTPGSKITIPRPEDRNVLEQYKYRNEK